MVFFAETKEECEKWWAQYGSQYGGVGAMQHVEVDAP
jgi:hypothetical protein